jgi:HD-GYP domain-containing protein (c-di-GMP phosphodiesterase class II)
MKTPYELSKKNLYQTMKISKLEFSLQNPLPYRFFFFIAFLFPIILYEYVDQGTHLTAFFLLQIFLVGLAFRSVWFKIIITGLITFTHFYFSPLGLPGVEIFLSTWLIDFLVPFSLCSIIKNQLTEKQNVINLTFALAKALDSRDEYTAQHSENVAHYGKMIAQHMGFSKKECENIYIGGLLHDIGKIGVSESILTKPSRLTDEEFEQIKKHPLIGYDTLKHIPLFEQNGVLDMVLYHHERYDGNGYPQGLKGEQIPVAARILAIADSFDAMTSRRVYRDEKETEYALSEIRKNEGIQFDPEIAQVFLKILEYKNPRTH